MAHCPTCKKETVQKYRPFCSKRCADIDLGQWMSGGYALPSEEPLGEHEVEQVIQHAQETLINDGNDTLH
ncbi:DNA gyrase inhibitor YacG [Temperatibacter marinus]|uniref:DNA gyrase inhibitor YacG n=1 Tax=Temperatibacter marinus TaxID=1456591 RepID=A0AA52EL69_9PROT|nr:DNA gyrase inhibitor YacG [Temperatibacter marinus]WND04046.1 DNA gyrase inhibitor YacG [Temperatibacter marinus]